MEKPCSQKKGGNVNIIHQEERAFTYAMSRGPVRSIPSLRFCKLPLLFTRESESDFARIETQAHDDVALSPASPIGRAHNLDRTLDQEGHPRRTTLAGLPLHATSS